MQPKTLMTSLGHKIAKATAATHYKWETTAPVYIALVYSNVY